MPSEDQVRSGCPRIRSAASGFSPARREAPCSAQQRSQSALRAKSRVTATFRLHLAPARLASTRGQRRGSARACAHTHINVCTSTCMHMCIHVCPNTHLCTHACVCQHMCAPILHSTYTQAHVCTHRHTPAGPLGLGPWMPADREPGLGPHPGTCGLSGLSRGCPHAADPEGRGRAGAGREVA